MHRVPAIFVDQQMKNLPLANWEVNRNEHAQIYSCREAVYLIANTDDNISERTSIAVWIV